MKEPYRNTFLSSDGKTAVSYKIWEPDGDVKNIRGVVQISHGMCEYVERYAGYAAHLCELGFVVGGNDHLGHGDTAPDADSLGFIAESDGPRYLVEDVHRMTGILKERYPDVPFVLLGHSMGSFIARSYLSLYAEELDAAIIMGTGGTKNPTGLGMFVADLVSAVCGQRRRSKMLTALAFGSYNKRCGKGADMRSWLTKDKEIAARYAADPYCNYIFTAQAYHDMFSLLDSVSTEEWARSVPTDLPILLISGDEDPVGNYGKGVHQVSGLLMGVGVRDVTVKLIRGDRHEVLNETDRTEVYAVIDEWLDDTLETVAERKRSSSPEEQPAEAE